MAEIGSAWKATYVDLFENFAGGCEGFDKNGLFIADVVRQSMKTCERQRKIFGECSIVTEDSQYSAARPMRLLAALAETTTPPKSERSARGIDFTNHPHVGPFAVIGPQDDR